jgi:predicted GNAT family acetyltransferase
MSTFIVKHDKKGKMFYVAVDGRNAGESPRVYYTELAPQSWNFDHTVTPEELQGRGQARIVVEGAFAYCDENQIDYSKSSCTYVVKLLKERQ